MPWQSNAPTILSGDIGYTSQVIATDSIPIFTAPFACRIISCSLIKKNALAASDVNFWEARLRKSSVDGTTQSTVANRFTNLAGGSVLSQVAWPLSTPDPVIGSLVVGEGLNLAFFLTGSSVGIVWDYLAYTIVLIRN